ncbi:hypothetical protein [Saccharothrix sp. NRRL B-16314]|uniref:hypothetical protein n=1 Tax=Saccharothrix sp. NRRL B-16314 TaxID=1463825 RepID=UPI0012DEA7EF|nr:hypothetical protein [Saccharothrix sp. NRRL B-16314]
MAQNYDAGSLRAALTLRASLLGPARTRMLTEVELVRAGQVLHGRPERLAVYGVPAPQMIRRGLRLLGRTAVECSVDDSCAAVTTALCAYLADARELSPGFVADLFCGSGNLGRHVGTGLGLPVFAAELDPDVYAATRHNFEVMGIDVNLRHTDYRDLLAGLPPPREGDVHLVEPPWGSAYTERGLDLTVTSPPVPEILAAIRASRAGVPCVVVSQVAVVGPEDAVTLPTLARCFADARHLTVIRPPSPFPDEATVEFHVYALPG